MSPTPTPVPALNLAGNFAQVRDAVLAEIAQICDSGSYVLGPKVAAFEEALAAYCGSKHALGVSSGTDALLVALMALGIGGGHEVIVPTFTFFATAGCVARVGARPVFCDIDPQTYNLDVGQVEEKLTMQTKAVIPVHLYGQLADLRPLLSTVNRYGIAVIEDAAQAIGAKESGPDGKMAGALGTIGCLSFYPTKNLGAIGDAGALLANDARLHEKATKLRLHGETTCYHHAYVGGNFRIDALQAAILTIKLKHLDRWNGERRKRAARYGELFEQAGLVPEHVRLPRSGAPALAQHGAGRGEGPPNHVYHQYVIRAQRRDELFEHLRARKIGAGIYYPVPLHLQECFAHLGHKPGDFPHAERAAAEVLGLPIYPELTDAQQEAVVKAVAAFYRR
ncbi:MAG: DegT/DnrJ/EryC1/StrS family aminotransferase [Phycisphaerae bacterium]